MIGLFFFCINKARMGLLRNVSLSLLLDIDPLHTGGNRGKYLIGDCVD